MIFFAFGVALTSILFAAAIAVPPPVTVVAKSR
jgi:hypothetical protein